ncbi:hypothetical protein CVIRNUC_000575 [Coccomyxa viridis]|uniref:NAD-dependent epimerase/dehydratase domain-containing protein n=1 Tax=Coccomyxa viridis TaxID=1274662 RepID=A0AAV1HQN5_9CHLO|nr:hypothetical protein CVIRNUC_000575 [Coccomyxa viridis]
MMLRPLRDSATICRSLAQTVLPALGTTEHTRSYASSDLAAFAVKNTGMRAGPGGRSSVSGVTATVFGCTGFLGRYIVNALARQGTQVVVPYRADDIDAQFLRQMGDLGQVYFWKDFDVRNDDHIRDAIKRSNVVINVIAKDKETWNFGFEEVNVDIPRRIAKLAAENPLTERFLHFSCIGASKDSASRRLRTKAEGEEAVRSIIPDATIYKLAHMVGTEDRMYNNYAQLAKMLPFIPIFDGGRTKLQPVYVRDVADAVISSLKRKEAVGKDYYLAGPDIFTIKEMIQLVFETIREPMRIVNVPVAIGKLLAAPRERFFKSIPIPVNYIFTADNIVENTQDHVLPSGVLTFKDLGVEPKKVTEGFPIEHLRYYRVGGYDFGTTSTTSSTGGAGYGGAGSME